MADWKCLKFFCGTCGEIGCVARAAAGTPDPDRAHLDEMGKNHLDAGICSAPRIESAQIETAEYLRLLKILAGREGASSSTLRAGGMN